ncbi:hypothetical protein Q5P01_015077 [Channa striata]|uniref:Interleukin-12 subunit beta n=1 Tax=Channa striata TaxID=64152 RepID=A0AA88MGN3_CHASR|nr:hypothetical protein Q5P01_015077 [Channa striata]
MGLGHNCSHAENSCQWVSKLADGGFQFELSHSLSPYAEETTKLEVTAEAFTKRSFRRTTKTFFLREIIKPDSPQIVTCEEVKENLTVNIDPPTSWSTPHSYFRLEHEIEFQFKDNGNVCTTIERSSTTQIPKRISKLRARSRDSLVRSNWSEWTPWKNVTC